MIIWIGNGCNFGDDGVEIGPIVSILLGEDEFGLEGDLKGSNMREDDILIGVGINILIFCNFKGDEMWWYHIANDFQVG